MVGQNLLPPLVDVLLRWRQHRFVLATDVEKMFRQILLKRPRSTTNHLALP